MAEEVGFEPTVQLPVHNISNVAPSTTRPLLRGNKYSLIYYVISFLQVFFIVFWTFFQFYRRKIKKTAPNIHNPAHR